MVPITSFLVCIFCLAVGSLKPSMTSLTRARSYKKFRIQPLHPER
jgi:hypothetical protein